MCATCPVLRQRLPVAGQRGSIDFIPDYFSEIPVLIERGLMPADVVFAMASP